MRIRSLSATALAATTAIFFSHHCLAQPADAETNSNVETQTSVSPTTSAMTTYYLTRTVMRVVETKTAAMPATDMSTFSTSLRRPSASVVATQYTNGTTSLLGTSATPTSSSIETGVSQPTQFGFADRLAIDSIGPAAIAGIVGLMLLRRWTLLCPVTL
ncbi:hypothetical protein KC340_g155 [Hortaea werneckii]|nr:hypothetical protein KC340_g155 [Hortaea werneckii]